MQTAKEHFTRLSGYTVNGNSRWVISYFHFLLEGEHKTTVDNPYALALSRASLLGGKKYHNSDFGGGIVFEGDPTSLAARINTFMERKEWVVTKVIFRKYPDGDIIALFPEIAGDRDWQNNCSSYMHIGQHGTANYKGVMSDTSPCSPQETINLRNELEGRGYNLRSMKRQTSADIQSRREVVEK